MPVSPHGDTRHLPVDERPPTLQPGDRVRINDNYPDDDYRGRKGEISALCPDPDAPYPVVVHLYATPKYKEFIYFFVTEDEIDRVDL